MLHKTLYIILFLYITLSGSGLTAQTYSKTWWTTGIRTAEKQYERMLRQARDLTQFPRTIDTTGNLKTVSIRDWTGGFWPGNLWLLYEYTGNPKWRAAAEKWTNALESNQFNTKHHDLGFMMYCSFGQGYRLHPTKKYRNVLLQSANSLAARFDPVVGSIESWDSRMSWDGETLWEYPVIIDNMMNLELLLFATKQTGDDTYRQMAISHADSTLKYHLRADYSTYHVVNYDPETGEVLQQQTCQGYSDNSTWARGQAWAIYGFTMMYRETGIQRYLETAIRLAAFYLKNSNMPEDGIPLWDFNVGQAGYVPHWNIQDRTLLPPPRDASAAAIVASALIELDGFSSKEYRFLQHAKSILHTLSDTPYLAEIGENANFILKHSTGSYPHNEEIDVPLVYADYYYLEALLRLKKVSDHE